MSNEAVEHAYFMSFPSYREAYEDDTNGQTLEDADPDAIYDAWCDDHLEDF